MVRWALKTHAGHPAGRKSKGMVRILLSEDGGSTFDVLAVVNQPSDVRSIRLTHLDPARRYLVSGTFSELGEHGVDASKGRRKAKIVGFTTRPDPAASDSASWKGRGVPWVS
eukprot:NODE_3935_length_860_cov_6.389642_g3265_i0.p2 GENE.NODE_3935_length_860_cov_6.389642_g3265_i0~~NODE_3935_length_860_cov_6.389642_g3265_i0.p2  ORF type:complete len:112 (-),score=13.81 NODE_3935_length_860_cov_6.389642_g3265_i0:36-371(-)